MKKITLLLAGLLLSAATSFAQTVASGDTGDCTWTLTGPEDNYTLTISGSGAMADYSADYSTDRPWYSFRSSIKQVIVENGVTRIGVYAFSYCASLTSVTIPNSVTSIGNDAFRDCTGLTSITIPNGVTSIGGYAFFGCNSLTSVTIGNSVESIGVSAFAMCRSLTEIIVEQGNVSYSSDNGVLFNLDKTTLVSYPGGRAGAYSIPNSVTGIGSAAFLFCLGLTEVTIPSSVTGIGDIAFVACLSLTDIIVEQGNVSYSSDNGVLFNLDKTTLVCYPPGKTGAYSIPNSVESIEDGAFYGCESLTEITIPNSVISIGNEAFSHIGPTSVTIPNSVESIGYYAFSLCHALTEVTIGNSVTSINEGAFYGCESLTSVANLNPTPQSITVGVFDFVDLRKATLYVPAESIEAYRAAPVWQDFGTIAAYVPAAIDAPVGEENDLWVYPNPVRDSFRIRGLAAPTLVEVTDLDGKIVWKQTLTGSESIPASHWPAGVYLLRVQDQTLKVVKN